MELMRKKIYKRFKEAHINGNWCVVVDEDNSGLIIARVPHWINNQKAVATALAKALTESDLALTDLI